MATQGEFTTMENEAARNIPSLPCVMWARHCARVTNERLTTVILCYLCSGCLFFNKTQHISIVHFRLCFLTDMLNTMLLTLNVKTNYMDIYLTMKVSVLKLSIDNWRQKLIKPYYHTLLTVNCIQYNVF